MSYVEYDAQVITDGAVRHWLLEDNTPFDDDVTGLNTSTYGIEGSPTTAGVAGPGDGSLGAYFNDTGAVLVNPSGPIEIAELTDITNFSVGCWVRRVTASPGVDTGWDTIWSTCQLAEGPIQFATQQDGNLYCLAPTITVLCDTADAPLADEEWHYCVYTKDGDDYAIYVDGQLNSTATDSQSVDFGGRPGMGVYNVGSGTYLDRPRLEMSRLALYPFTLTLEQITTHYDHMFPEPATPAFAGGVDFY